MTASRDIQNARPNSQHRAGAGSSASSVPGRSSYSRPHAHSISLGSLNPGHRVSRRKSSSSMGGVNIAALTAVAKDGVIDGKVKADKYSPGAVNASSYALQQANASSKDSSAVVDGPSLSTMSTEKASSKSRNRRASEGSRLTKGGGEHRKSNAGDLRCDQCGKTYKHGSCLSKHLWEHTPEWALTSKLLISKHQQVQLLEAASVLINMNQDGPHNESAIHHDSDLSSDSPAPSGTSDMRDEDELSSRTSTPSLEDSTIRKGTSYRPPKREDSYSSAYSRSYQSVSDHPNLPYVATSAPGERDAFSYYNQWSSERPSTAHSSANDVAAAAEGLIGVSLNTPKTGPTHLGSDVPPIPPIPAKYAAHQHSPSYRMDVDVVRPPTRGLDDEDELVFGRMEQ